jgi:hypothetical protein
MEILVAVIHEDSVLSGVEKSITLPKGVEDY